MSSVKKQILPIYQKLKANLKILTVGSPETVSLYTHAKFKAPSFKYLEEETNVKLRWEALKNLIASSEPWMCPWFRVFKRFKQFYFAILNRIVLDK